MLKNIQMIVFIMNYQMQSTVGAKKGLFFSLPHYHHQVDKLMY